MNDVFILCGTVIKLRISAAATTEMPLYNACGMLLGVGNLLVWVGILRYLGFFRTYNILILTFKRAIPNVLRYMACIILIFCGFAFCGWIVLGPYHVKFQVQFSVLRRLTLVNTSNFAFIEAISLLLVDFSLHDGDYLQPDQRRRHVRHVRHSPLAELDDLVL